jgi:hypothetical protein
MILHRASHRKPLPVFGFIQIDNFLGYRLVCTLDLVTLNLIVCAPLKKRVAK